VKPTESRLALDPSGSSFEEEADLDASEHLASAARAAEREGAEERSASGDVNLLGIPIRMGFRVG
jgi:hypothetical protein